MTTVSNTTSTTASTTSNTGTGTNALSQSEKNFLTLITAQLKNQDPTDTNSLTSYYSTLAQYYAVDTQSTSNTKLDSILTELQKVDADLQKQSTTTTTA